MCVILLLFLAFSKFLYVQFRKVAMERLVIQEPACWWEISW